MELMPWKPFKDLASVRDEMNKMFEDFFKKTSKLIPKMPWSPPIDAKGVRS